MNTARPPREKPPGKPLSVPLPTKDGVGPSCVALPPGPWGSIDEFLTERFAAIPADIWRARMQQGELVTEHGAAIAPGQPYRAGLRLYYYRAIDDEPKVPFEEVLLFQDELLVAVDKPHFLSVTPGGRHLHETLLVRLKRRLGIDTLTPLHRLDRETAGVVVFSVQPATRGAYQALFAHKTVSKHYEAIAPWRPELAFPLTRRSRLVEDDHFLRMREAPGEPNAETHLEVIESHGGFARYRLTPVTGRTHQLRVHCAALGLPIAGDRMYPTLMAVDTDDHTRPLQLLARGLAFTDPVTGQERRFETARQLASLRDTDRLNGPAAAPPARP